MLKNFVNPPKAIDRSLNYFDLAITLDVRRDTNVKMGHLDALEWLKQANRAFHDTSPQVLRCEMHDYTYSDTNIKVHIKYVDIGSGLGVRTDNLAQYTIRQPA